MKTIALIVALTVGILVVPTACDLLPEQQAAINAVPQTMLDAIEETEGRIAALEQARDEAGSEEEMAEVTELLEGARAVLETLRAEIENLERFRDDEGNIDAGAAATEVATRFLPPPWNLLVPAIGGLAAGLVRSAQQGKRGRAAVRALKAVETAKKRVPDFATAMANPNVIAILDDVGDDAKKAVDDMQEGILPPLV